MEYKIEKLSENRLQIKVTAPVEDYQAALKKSFEKNRGYFQIKGFRKGKAPYEMVKRMYGVEALAEDADNFLINDTYFKIVKDENLKVASMPEIKELNAGEDKPFEYTAEVEIVPDFTLPEVEGLEAEKHEHPWSEAAVDEQLENMREQNARIRTKEEDGIVEDKDIANIDFTGYIDDKAFEGGEGKGYDLTIGSGSFIGDFEDQLKGLKAGEEKDVVVSFPENYGRDELNGKLATFKVKVNEIKVKELPELDDDFASEVSEFETVEELRGDLSKKMKEEYDVHMENAAKDAILLAVTDKTDLNVPEAYVEQELDNMIKDLEQRLMYQGIKMDQYYAMLGKTEAEMRESMKADAEKRAKVNLIVEKIVENSDFEPSEDNLKELAHKYAKQYGLGEDYEKRLLENNRDGLVSDAKLHNYLTSAMDKVKWVAGHDHDHDHHHE